MITVRNTQRAVDVSLTSLKQRARLIKDALGYRNYDLGIWLATDRQIRALNSRYRKIASTTDILAFSNFPSHEFKEGIHVVGKIPPYEMLQLGDLVFGMGYIYRVCLVEHRNLARYMDRLLVHGMCHLVGYDHKTIEQASLMRAKEDSLLQHLGSSTRRGIDRTTKRMS
jgi:probable rRNA maturation factor